MSQIYKTVLRKNSLYSIKLSTMFIKVNVIPVTQISSDDDTDFSVEIDLSDLGVDVEAEQRYINVTHIESVEPLEKGSLICMACNIEYKVLEGAEMVMSLIREAQRNYILS
jgi:hypothetical protein